MSTDDETPGPPMRIARIPEHGHTAVGPGIKGVLYYPKHPRNLYAPHLQHPGFLGVGENGRPKNHPVWNQPVVLEDKDAHPQRGAVGGVGALMDRAVRNAALPAGWAPGQPLPDVASYPRTRLGGLGTAAWLAAKGDDLRRWMESPRRGGWPCQRCLALGAPATLATRDPHRWVIGAIDTGDAPWFEAGALHMAEFWHIPNEWICGVENGAPGPALSSYSHRAGEPSLEGDFVPYAHRVAQMIEHLGRWDVDVHGRLDFAAFFCHGWNDGVQLGLVAEGAQGESSDARRLTRVFLEMLAERAADDLSISLYACKTATAQDTYGISYDGHATLASSLRKELFELGIRNVRVDGHVDSADGIRARRVRRFEGERPQGLWVVPPPGAEEFQEDAEEAYVEDVAREAIAVETRVLIAAAERLGAPQAARSIRTKYNTALRHLRNGAVARARRAIDECLALFDLYQQARALREQLWSAAAPAGTVDTRAARLAACHRGENNWLQGRYGPAAEGFRACLEARGVVPHPPDSILDGERLLASETGAAERERMLADRAPAEGYDEVRWGKWYRSLAMGYEYLNFRYPLMTRDEIVAWLDALPPSAPCLSDWRVTESAAGRSGEPVTPGTELVHEHIWLWETKKPEGCFGATRRLRLSTGYFSSDYIRDPVAPPPVRVPRAEGRTGHTHRRNRRSR